MPYYILPVLLVLFLSGCGEKEAPEETKQEHVLKKQVGTLQDARDVKALTDETVKEREKAAESLVN